MGMLGMMGVCAAACLSFLGASRTRPAWSPEVWAGRPLAAGLVVSPHPAWAWRAYGGWNWLHGSAAQAGLDAFRSVVPGRVSVAAGGVWWNGRDGTWLGPRALTRVEIPGTTPVGRFGVEAGPVIYVSPRVAVEWNAGVTWRWRM